MIIEIPYNRFFNIGEEYVQAIYGEMEYEQKEEKIVASSIALEIGPIQVHCYMHNDTLLIHT